MEKDGRNYGIDALRLAAMFLVVMLHTSGLARRGTAVGEPAYYLTHFFRIAAYPCVDIFAIISGYVGWNRPLRFSNVAGIWLQIAWHTVLITALTALLRPEWIGEGYWKKAFFPVITKEYWYITSFFIMLLFVPIIQWVLKRIPNSVLWVIIGTLLLINSLLSTALHRNYGMGKGYNAKWLIVMYLLGAAMARSRLLKRIKTALPGFLLYAVTVCAVFLIIYLTNNKDWMDYTSPLTILSAVGLVHAFSCIRPKRSVGLIRLLTPTALAVFVTHVHTIPWKHFSAVWPSRLHLWTHEKLLLLSVNMLLWSLFIYLVCTLMDLIRIKIFAWLRIPTALKKVDAWLDRIASRIRGQADGASDH